jgi:hypothetical protein
VVGHRDCHDWVGQSSDDSQIGHPTPGNEFL